MININLERCTGCGACVEICPEGAVIEAETGISICDAALANGIEIEHACEKSCACTTCHVIVREGFDSLNESSEDEEDLLAHLQVSGGAVDPVQTIHRQHALLSRPEGGDQIEQGKVGRAVAVNVLHLEMVR